MSYRITASNEKRSDRDLPGRIYCQVYGNNDFPEQLRNYLKESGCDLDDEDGFKDFEVKDIQALLEVMLEIHNEQVEDDTYWDFKPGKTFKVDTPDDLLGYIGYKLDVAVVLTMYNFYQSFEHLIETYWDKEDHEPKYKIKEGKHIYLSGY